MSTSLQSPEAAFRVMQVSIFPRLSIDSARYWVELHPTHARISSGHFVLTVR